MPSPASCATGMRQVVTRAPARIRRYSPRGNGLRKLAGTWNEEEFRSFGQAVASFGQIDEELWR